MPYERLRGSFSGLVSPLRGTVGPERSERREQRISIDIPVVVCGFNASGRLFSELASTHDISRSGCCIYLRMQPQREASLAIRLSCRGDAETGEIIQVLLRTVWVEPREGRWAVGTCVLDNTDLRTVISHFCKP